MDNKKTPPLTPRGFISAFRDLVGDTYLIKLFGLSPHKNSGPRSLCRWTAKRPYVDEDSIRENWIEKHEKVLKRLLQEPGGLEIARALVARHAYIVGCELSVKTEILPDKATMEDECLDDYPAITRFHESIRDINPVPRVRHLWTEAKRELDETLAFYEGTRGEGKEDV
ncbi:MAG: hypothetical protein JRF53_00420 [Deltaproteobacteria bacterium]|nr:hypothetical protein [Deltaproteobacteria bacterium]